LEKPTTHAYFEQPRVTDGHKLIPILAAHRKEEYFVHLGTSMYRRRAAVAVLEEYADIFELPDLPCEDYPLILALATHGKFAWSPDIYLHYRVGQLSITSTENTLKVVRFTCRVIWLSLKFSERLNVAREIMLPYYRFDVNYALMIGFDDNDSESMAIVRNFIKEMAPRWRIGWKTRIALVLCRNSLMVRIVNIIRKKVHGY